MIPIQTLQAIPVPEDTDSVCCDGGGALGHPAVYYTFDGCTEIECQYCDQIFVKTAHTR